MKAFPSTLTSVFTIAALSVPYHVSAEFYTYEDRDGTVHFVEDASKIPRQYRQKAHIRKDEYDDLPADERALLLEQERAKRAENRRREDEHLERARQQRSAEESAAEADRRHKALTTPVVIQGRQVFVPVRLKHGDAQAEVMLLLDTGATSSVITPEVAERLKVVESDHVRIGVVGGRVMKARRVILNQMEVGPVKRLNQEAVIVRQSSGTFGDGLLGMSFLGGLKYTIDFKTSTINWIP